MGISPLLASAAAFFDAEPAAVSLVAELGDDFVAVVRHGDGAKAVGTFPTEDAALAALEAYSAREAMRTLMGDYAEHAAGDHDDLMIDCSVCRIEASVLGLALPEVTK